MTDSAILSNHYDQQAWIYRAGREPELRNDFSGHVLSGEEVMPGLELPLEKLRAEP